VDEARNRALIAWYGANRRPLPWRATTDPWAILVSEVMLQQTQAARVEPVYVGFLARFPSPAAMAAASRAEVIRQWGGLGYQRRALALHAASAEIAARGWPRRAEDLLRLPGVGPYTAAAVACFAFGEPVAAVDVNLRRVLSRWAGAPLSGGELACRAAEALDVSRPSEWNQAVMDLGALLCRPRTPRCGACPVARWCADPTVEVPSTTQPAYPGSRRQARAAVLRHLAGAGPTSVDDLARALGIDPDRVEQACVALAAEGSIRHAGGVAAIDEA
jgi:A/G-specific adenine glycosylase